MVITLPDKSDYAMLYLRQRTMRIDGNSIILFQI